MEGRKDGMKKSVVPIDTLDNPVYSEHEEPDQADWHECAKQAEQAGDGGWQAVNQPNQPQANHKQQEERACKQAKVGLGGVFSKVASHE